MSGEGGVLDLRQLPATVPGRRSSIWLGMALFVVIEATVMVSLVTCYWYFRVMAPAGWPPPGVEPPELTTPALSLVGLAATLGLVLVARRAHRDGQRRRFVLTLGAGCGLLALYLGVALHDMVTLPYEWSEHVYGSLMWTLSGYQLMHGLGLLLLALGILGVGCWPWTVQAGSREEPGRPRDAAVSVLVLYWSFVVIASLPTYFTLYLAPHVL